MFDIREDSSRKGHDCNLKLFLIIPCEKKVLWGVKQLGKVVLSAGRFAWWNPWVTFGLWGNFFKLDISWVGLSLRSSQNSLRTSHGLNWENKTFKVKRSTFKLQKYVNRPFYTGLCLSPGVLIERFPLDCCKTKTKVNTLANQRA